MSIFSNTARGLQRQAKLLGVHLKLGRLHTCGLSFLRLAALIAIECERKGIQFTIGILLTFSLLNPAQISSVGLRNAAHSRSRTRDYSTFHRKQMAEKFHLAFFIHHLFALLSFSFTSN
jgi:hypothetical protein